MPPVVLAQDDATRIEVGDAASEVVVGGPSKNGASSQPSTLYRRCQNARSTPIAENTIAPMGNAMRAARSIRVAVS